MVIRQVLISGYYGFDNSGDEAVLLAILQALAEAADDIEPIVLSADPAKTSRAYGVRAVSRTEPRALVSAMRAADGLISGGGSLLQDATGWTTIPYYLGILRLAQWFGKPTFVYAQGIGPIGRRLFYPLIRGVFRRTVYLSVRDPESARLLERIGLPSSRIDLVPDPVMGLRPIAREAAEELIRLEGLSLERPIIGIAIRGWQGSEAIIDETARMADALVEQGHTVWFLPFHYPQDRDTSREVLLRMRHKAHLLDRPLDPREMLGIVGCLRLLVGMRLHALIYAAAQRVPLVGISYDPKIDQFLSRLGLTPACTAAAPDHRRLLAHIAPLLADPDGWRQQVERPIADLQREVSIPAQQIARRMRIGG